MKVSNQKLASLALLIAVTVAASCSTVSDFESVNTNVDGVALHGFDAVAYFAVDSAVEGNRTYSYGWNGAKWLFANAENLEKFKQNPESYAPQYGGYCSYAVSNGYTADIDPQAWKIVEGKLFLNYSQEVKEIWEKGQLENIKKATENWKEFKTKKPAHKG